MALGGLITWGVPMEPWALGIKIVRGLLLSTLGGLLASGRAEPWALYFNCESPPQGLKI